MNFFVKKFYKEMRESPNFRKKILEAKRRYEYLKEPKDKLCTIIEKVILPFAEEKGYNFDIYDLLIFEEEASVDGAQLIEEPLLEKVSGGQQRCDKNNIFCIANMLNIDEDIGDIATYWFEKKNNAGM